jgi:hypothetical protein
MLLSRQRSQKCREIIWETFKKKEETGEQRRGVSVRSRLLSHKYRLFKKKTAHAITLLLMTQMKKIYRKRNGSKNTTNH